MADKLVRGNSMDGAIRVFAAVTTDLVNEAQRIHHTYPVATAALGRLLTGAAIMGAAGLKNETDSMTVQIKGEGEITNLVAVTDCHSRVRGYVSNPYVDRPLNNKGKLDVGGAIGGGYLSVVRDLGLKEPYVGQTQLVTGEIAEDLTYYFANSEQVPSSVGLGVLMDKDNTVRQAGGFIIQLMPFVEDGVVDKLEQKLNSIDSVTSYLDRGFTPEQLLTEILGEFGLEIHDKMDAQFHCNCSRERVEKALISVGRKNLNEMVQDGKPIEVKCHFCNTPYTFDVEDLKNMIKRSK